MKREFLWIAGSMRDVTDRALRRKTRLEEKQIVTRRVSETCRYIGFGLLGMFYAIKSSNSAFAVKLTNDHSHALTIVALSGAAAVLCDYLQYVFAAFAIENALNREDASHLFNTSWWSLQAREVCFWIKQAAAFVGAVVLSLFLLTA